MASTGKTPKLGLNQWAGSDDVLRSDFNRDNVKIDEGVVAAEALAEKAYVVAGSYDGNGVKGRVINLGFCPKLVLFQGRTSASDIFVVLSRDGLTHVQGNMLTFLENSNAEVVMDNTGFLLKSTQFLNCPGNTTRYFAFR
ncbi:MAG: hypothetical protein RSB55_04755 [Oscillospiraceae bacterium]